jgi:hypothetical protein
VVSLKRLIEGQGAARHLCRTSLAKALDPYLSAMNHSLSIDGTRMHTRKPTSRWRTLRRYLPRNVWRPAFAIALMLVLSSVAPPSARAEAGVPEAVSSPGSVPQTTNGSMLTVDEERAMAKELEASGVELAISRINGTLIRTFAIGEGISISVPSALPADRDGGVASSLIGAGYEGGRRVFVSFNRTDQEALATGGGTALGAAICVVGSPVACGIAGTIIAVALVYLNNNGICGGGRELRIYASTLRGRCV